MVGPVRVSAKEAVESGRDVTWPGWGLSQSRSLQKVGGRCR